MDTPTREQENRADEMALEYGSCAVSVEGENVRVSASYLAPAPHTRGGDRCVTVIRLFDQDGREVRDAR